MGRPQNDIVILPLEPSESPQAVAVTVVSSKSINVSWSPVSFQERNGIIEGYKVMYKALPNGKDKIKIVNVTINDQNEEQTLTIGELNEFTNYSIRVLAFTAVGDGQVSVAEVKQTLEDSKFKFGIYAINVTSKYSVAACKNIMLTAFFILFYLKIMIYIFNNLPLLHYHRQSFLVKFFNIFYILPCTFYQLQLFINFMNDKIVSERRRFMSSHVYLSI